MRTVIDAATLPPARSFHGWALADDLPDRSVKLSALEERDTAALELRDALCVAFLADRYGGPDGTAAGAATVRLVEAQIRARMAEMALTSQWARVIGGDIRRKPGIAEEKKSAEGTARQASTARWVAVAREREIEWRSRMASAHAPLGASPVVTEPSVSPEKAGLGGEPRGV